MSDTTKNYLQAVRTGIVQHIEAYKQQSAVHTNEAAKNAELAKRLEQDLAACDEAIAAMTDAPALATPRRRKKDSEAQ